MAGHRYAVLFGNGSFSPEEKNLVPLRCPINDINGLAALLESEKYGGYAVTKIADGSHDAVRLAIFQRLAVATRHDSVLIYFSGHGKLDQDGNLFFVTQDTRMETLPPTSVSLDEIGKYVDKSRASSVVVVLDCCYSGAVGKLFKGGVGGQATSAFRNLITRTRERTSTHSRDGTGRFYLSASTDIQLAEEKEGDDYSLLTKHIIEGIRSGAADTNDDGMISFQELVEYVQVEVPAEGSQEPRSWSLNAGGNVTVALSGKSELDERRRTVESALRDMAAHDPSTAPSIAVIEAIIKSPPNVKTRSAKSVGQIIDLLHSNVGDPTKLLKAVHGITEADKRAHAWAKTWSLRVACGVIVGVLGYYSYRILSYPHHLIAAHFAQPSTPYSLGKDARYSNSVAIADFDGDRILDIVSANQDTANVSILRGNGDGTFRPGITFPACDHPYAVVVGHFTRKNLLDLAVSCKGDPGKPGISVLLGRVDGTFQPPVEYPAGQAPTELTTGDFDHDGIQDLAVGSWVDNKIRILRGKGDGTFGQPQEFAVPLNPVASISVGDFNNDGVMDLVVANTSSNSVFVLMGLGHGSFGAPIPYDTDVLQKGAPPWWGVYSVAVGDFNRDGIRDLAVTNFSGNNVGVLLGRKDGTFAPPRTFRTGAGPFKVAIGDFNGDGREDLATSNNSNTVSVLLGYGDGTFREPQDFEAGNSPASIAAGEFTGGHRPDLVVANREATTVSVLLNQAALTTTLLSSSSNPSTLGFDVSFSAKVKDGTNAPAQGKLELRIDDNPPVVIDLKRGAATFSTRTLSGGFHHITATFKAGPGLLSSKDELTQEVR